MESSVFESYNNLVLVAYGLTSLLDPAAGLSSKDVAAVYDALQVVNKVRKKKLEIMGENNDDTK